MFKNLKNTLLQNGFTMKGYAEFLEISEKSVNNKINQETEFTFSEFEKTCKFLLPQYSPSYLFARDEART